MHEASQPSIRDPGPAPGAPGTARRGRRLLAVACAALLAGACAGDAFLRPGGFEDGALRARAASASDGGIRASAAIPSRAEAMAIFGVDMLEKGIEPVWVEIENGTRGPVYFIRTGLDPEYYSPREVAFAVSGSMGDEARSGLVEHIEGLDFRDPIEPGTKVSGFVFTYRDLGSKFVNIDVVGEKSASHLTMVVASPDNAPGSNRVARLKAAIAVAKAIRTQDGSELRTLLEKLPCCVASEDGVQGEPLNVVMVGSVEAIGTALIRRGYRYHPAPPRYAFGRAQDVSMSKQDTWVAAQPHVLRVWLTDIRYQGDPVWLVQIGMPLGGRFASEDERVLIDPDVDAARDDFFQDGFYSQLVAEVGFVTGAGKVPRATPRTTPGGSTYYTDGLRAVMFFTQDPLSLSEIEFIAWEAPADHRAP